MAALPMFPLGTVLLPGALLPLHVFEPRYRALVRHCLEGTPEFGVVLIERGSEVGGGDVRTGIGTVARILQVARLPDGRFRLVTVGTRRIRVTGWLPDDPYPRAEVDDWPDDPAGADETQLDTVVAHLRRVLALKAELGEPVPPATTQIASDVVQGSYQASALAPVGPIDRQHLLAQPGPAARLARLAELLAEEEAVLHLRLGHGGGTPG